jgi:hypothetical protein
MSLTISIRFLNGRAHLHPWQTHHSEGRVEWPPSPWRLLRALVAVAGRGLTSLPYPDDVPATKSELKVAVAGVATLKKRGVPKEFQGNLSLSKAGVLTLKASMTDAEYDSWKSANMGDSFAAALDQLRSLASAPEPAAMTDVESDAIPLSRLAQLLHTLSATATIWLPKTAGGHTRQYFPIHSGGMVKNSGSAVFDTFATVRKDQPLLFHWADMNLDAQHLNDLKLLLSRITYFGRAESWCRAEVHSCSLEKIFTEGMSQILPKKTHWECVCIEGTEHRQPDGREYRDYLLERRLAPFKEMNAEVIDLLPRTNTSNGKKRNAAEANALKAVLQAESPEKLLLRCLLRESGQDIKDGLERPIGTRWVHYAVPREIYDVPRQKVQPSPRTAETIDFVRYALNTATVNRPVLPAITDTLLVADRFRSAVMALCREPSRALSGHEADGSPSKDHQHAFWWPLDEDNDGFIDHVNVWAPGGFEQYEVEALRRLTRLRQRGRRPDLLVTPIIIGSAAVYKPWTGMREGKENQLTKVFVSATPYFCPIHLSHGRGKSGRIRSLKREVLKGLLLQQVIDSENEIFEVEEFVFDHSPNQRTSVVEAITSQVTKEPTSPRQFFPVTHTTNEFPSLPKRNVTSDARYIGAFLKAADQGYCLGTTLGFWVNHGTRFIRALSFGRRRRNHQLRSSARMLQITFCQPRAPKPFAIGDQCHFGLGLFVPETGS